MVLISNIQDSCKPIVRQLNFVESPEMLFFIKVKAR
jgi:hypothetical protein